MEGTIDVRWRKSSYSGNGGGSCVEVATMWRKSSYSGNGGGDCIEVGTAWHKSSHSGNGGNNCVEVARGPVTVAVRDSKDPDGPVLSLAPAGWRDFIADVRTGRYDLT